MDLVKTLAFSAVGGMVVGTIGCGGDAKKTEEPTGDSTATPAADSAAPAAGDAAAACCKGKNECKGKGGCKVEGANECGGKNECKGKGGCSHRDCAAK